MRTPYTVEVIIQVQNIFFKIFLITNYLSMNNPITRNYLHYLKTWRNNTFRVDIHLIAWCNFRCVMCDNWKKKVELNFSFEDLKKYIVILRKIYACNYVRFHGQEPSLYMQLEELVLFTKKMGMKVAIKTNWWLINDSRLIKIIGNWLDELYLSIDWPTADIHDQIRWFSGSFQKNIHLIEKSRKLNPELKIYINSVVMKSNHTVLAEMVDFWKKYGLDRVSFVFLNDKNRKDIDHLNLDRVEFSDFFRKQVIDIYQRSYNLGISVDFSPFLSGLTTKSPDFIVGELQNNFTKYIPEIEAFYNGDYGKYFYDRYGCFGPIDHASINYNGDMYGCCVVERDSANSVWNILQDNLLELWKSERYKEYRENSNESCWYSRKCASNFYTRKNLFKDIYLNDAIYPKDSPRSYYRYLLELQNETEEVKDVIKLKKLRQILLYFYENLDFYRDLLLVQGITLQDIKWISNLGFIKRLPILDKKILSERAEDIQKLSEGRGVVHWKTSGSSWKRLDFYYPLDFKRFVKQIAIFSDEFGFTFDDYYFYLTPINCNQMRLNDIDEPEYVKKVYIPTTTKYDFSEKYFLKVQSVFQENKNVLYLHTDSKYLLYIIFWFEKYNLPLPSLYWISLTYSYTNRSLREFIEGKFGCVVSDNYWCSEVWPISIEKNGEKKVFWDSILLEEVDNKFIITDLDNDVFPFIRYSNEDIWLYDWNTIEIQGKDSQILHWRTLKEIDEFFYRNFPTILLYQFSDTEMTYYSLNPINVDILAKELFTFTWIEYDIKSLISSFSNFLNIWDCGKFGIV